VQLDLRWYGDSWYVLAGQALQAASAGVVVEDKRSSLLHKGWDVQASALFVVE
jgi:hypothetical protein